MKGFFYILNKIINIENHPLLYRYDSTDPVSPMIKTFFTHFIYDKKAYKNKFAFLQHTMESIFLNDVTKKEMLELFSKIQKTYSSFRRFGYLYKLKKSKIVVNMDMELNEIVENHPHIICIYQDFSKYLFNIKDLIQIINTSLTNSYVFFAEPKPIKNPFNNMAFNKSTLYTIYFYIKFQTHLYPELVFKFFQSNFDLTYFLYNNEFLLREYAIDNYVNKSPENIVFKEIIDMIKEYNNECIRQEDKLYIHVEFPKKKLIKIMKPYLLLYFKMMYSLVSLVRLQCKKELYCKLQFFQKKNPYFSRKIAVIKRIPKNMINFQTSTVVSHYKFNDMHTPFHVDNNFLLSHLRVDNETLFHQQGIGVNYYEELGRNEQPNEINTGYFYFNYLETTDDDDDDDDDDETMEETDSIS